MRRRAERQLWERIFNEQRVAEWPAPRTLCGLQDTGPLLLLVGGKAQPVIPLKEGGGAGGPSGDIWAYEYATKQWQLLSEDASAAAGRAGKVPGEEGEVRGFNEVDRPLTGSEAQTDKLPGLEGLSFAWMHHPNYGVVWGGYERGHEYSDGLYKLDITPACVQDKKCKYPQTDIEQCGARHGVGGCINGKCECNPAFLQASFAGTEGLPKAVAVTPVTDIACPMGCPAARSHQATASDGHHLMSSNDLMWVYGGQTGDDVIPALKEANIEAGTDRRYSYFGDLGSCR